MSKLFVFEGPDGVGKTSLIASLAARLSKEGDVVVVDYPGRSEGTLAEAAYDICHNSSPSVTETLTPLATQTLYVAAQVQGIEKAILPLMAKSDQILLDRYWWSTIAYGIRDGLSAGNLSALKTLALNGWEDILPSALFLVHREYPLKPEPLDRWASCKKAYNRIFQEETGHYPLFKVSNDGLLEETTSEVQALIDSLTLD